MQKDGLRMGRVTFQESRNIRYNFILFLLLELPLPLLCCINYHYFLIARSYQIQPKDTYIEIIQMVILIGDGQNI